MNITIVAGSNRANSGSRKVADYVFHCLEEQKQTTVLWDMHEEALPLWTEDLWNKDSDQTKNWQPYKEQLQKTDALVLIAPEWNGTTAPSLQNFIMHLNRPEVGHKPVLLVGVSAGIGGTYPIAELKAYANKNNRMVFIPDHVIVRGVGNILNDTNLDESDERDYEAKLRLQASLGELMVYATHLEKVRAELQFDYKTFKNGL